MDKYRYKNDQTFISNTNVDQMIAQETIQSDVYEADERRVGDSTSDSWPWMEDSISEFARGKKFSFFSFLSKILRRNHFTATAKKQRAENEYSEERFKIKHYS